MTIDWGELWYVYKFEPVGERELGGFKWSCRPVVADNCVLLSQEMLRIIILDSSWLYDLHNFILLSFSFTFFISLTLSYSILTAIWNLNNNVCLCVFFEKVYITMDRCKSRSTQVRRLVITVADHNHKKWTVTSMLGWSQKLPSGIQTANLSMWDTSQY